jgi:hypothetical protein
MGNEAESQWHIMCVLWLMDSSKSWRFIMIPQAHLRQLSVTHRFHIMFVLAIMAGCPVHIVDIQGAFLHSGSKNGEEIYMKVPQGLEHFYNLDTHWLKLQQTFYSLIQSAVAFWCKLILAFAKIGFKHCKADPCMFFKWTNSGIIIFTVIVSNCCGTGLEQGQGAEDLRL